jgi:hypothetical protein
LDQGAPIQRSSSDCDRFGVYTSPIQLMEINAVCCWKAYWIGMVPREERILPFIVFQCSESPGYFVVTDKEHVAHVKKTSCPGGGELKEVGEYSELEKAWVAFDESLATRSIASKGYYCFEASAAAAVTASNPEMH